MNQLGHAIAKVLEHANPSIRGGVVRRGQRTYAAVHYDNVTLAERLPAAYLATAGNTRVELVAGVLGRLVKRLELHVPF